MTNKNFVQSNPATKVFHAITILVLAVFLSLGFHSTVKAESAEDFVTPTIDTAISCTTIGSTSYRSTKEYTMVFRLSMSGSEIETAISSGKISDGKVSVLEKVLYGHEEAEQVQLSATVVIRVSGCATAQYTTDETMVDVNEGIYASYEEATEAAENSAEALAEYGVSLKLAEAKSWTPLEILENADTIEPVGEICDPLFIVG